MTSFPFVISDTLYSLMILPVSSYNVTDDVLIVRAEMVLLHKI